MESPRENTILSIVQSIQWILVAECISFIYNTNRWEPSMEPWGTPYEIAVSEDRQPSIYTNCVLLVRYN